MTESSRRTPSKKGLTPFGVIGFIFGLALFAYFVKKSGVASDCAIDRVDALHGGPVPAAFPRCVSRARDGRCDWQHSSLRRLFGFRASQAGADSRSRAVDGWFLSAGD